MKLVTALALLAFIGIAFATKSSNSHEVAKMVALAQLQNPSSNSHKVAKMIALAQLQNPNYQAPPQYPGVYQNLYLRCMKDRGYQPLSDTHLFNFLGLNDMFYQPYTKCMEARNWRPLPLSDQDEESSSYAKIKRALKKAAKKAKKAMKKAAKKAKRAVKKAARKARKALKKAGKFIGEFAEGDSEGDKTEKTEETDVKKTEAAAAKDESSNTPADATTVEASVNDATPAEGDSAAETQSDKRGKKKKKKFFKKFFKGFKKFGKGLFGMAKQAAMMYASTQGQQGQEEAPSATEEASSEVAAPVEVAPADDVSAESQSDKGNDEKLSAAIRALRSIMEKVNINTSNDKEESQLKSLVKILVNNKLKKLEREKLRRKCVRTFDLAEH